jgi:hypothetical protein
MSEGEEAFPTPPGMPTPEKPPTKPTPEQEKYLNLVKELTDASAMLVIKVATTQCNHKDECGVYDQARKIAFIIDKLQSLRAETPKTSGVERVKGARTRRNV